jgi:alkanesulfonate monooxygenase SsuD/methylene tetrahydromethanopterin reductase-like flavin-dependent oxidoreductase (luciferase family)
MPVEFLGIAATSDGSEITARSGSAFDREYTLRLARAHEENGWDRVLFAYGSGSPDPNIGAAYIASKTERLQLLLAHRPNVSYPTFAAKTFATVDQVSNGRMTVHFITGGTDHEQQREGDYLTKDERYERTRECMQIVKKAWTSRDPFDSISNPENTGSQRLIAIAEEGERFDRALWTRTAAVTGGSGNSNALVGTPETVAQAILDYIDLGVDIISMRGYDLLKDAIEVGQQVIPIVREEVAKRDAALAR